MIDEGEHIKEVYARFGLAIYCAQVLEHGLVNAMIAVDLIPNQRGQASSQADWEARYDAFSDFHFKSTMGRMMRDLRGLTTVPPDFESLLTDALSKRNWLAHNFFRERAEEFMTEEGREKMLVEVDACRDAFKDADTRLDEVVQPLRDKEGITADRIAQEFDEMVARVRGES